MANSDRPKCERCGETRDQHTVEWRCPGFVEEEATTLDESDDYDFVV